MSERPAYWFPAKTYGWGWGIPTVWQGWVVLIVFIALLIAGAGWLLPGYGKPFFVVYTLFMSALLVFVCWLKGEPTAWHWGNK